MTAEDAGFAAYNSESTETDGAIGIGDVNGDGYDDLELSLPNPPGVFVQFGPVVADFDLVDADVQLNGPYYAASALRHAACQSRSTPERPHQACSGSRSRRRCAHRSTSRRQVAGYTTPPTITPLQAGTKRFGALGTGRVTSANKR
jgi:hypothetical protein